MEVWLVCFDISDNQVRTRIGKCLLRYGERIQESVFEISVRRRQDLEQVKQQLRDIQGEETNIRFYRLCASCRSASSTLAGEPVASFPGVIIL